LIGGFTHHLLRYDYDRVRAMTMGIAAFNQGETALSAWTHRDHSKLLEQTGITGKRELTEGLEAIQFADARRLTANQLRGTNRALRMAGRFVADLLLPRRSFELAVLAPGETWRPDFIDRPAVVAELDQSNVVKAVYRYNWRASWAATGLFLLALTRMVVQFHQPMPLGRVIE
jgi:hypothetical protein